MPLTITEALAEIKTINKRLEKKRDFIKTYLWRQDALKDPHAADGGSAQLIKQERQAIKDLEARIVALRIAINKANTATPVVVNGDTRTIQEWLTWRRDVMPGEKQFLGTLREGLARMRQEAQRKGVGVFESDTPAKGGTDVIVNMNEMALAKEIETMEETLGILDGQLSLKDATVIIDA